MFSNILESYLGDAAETPSYVEIRLRRVQGQLYSAMNSTLALCDLDFNCVANRKALNGAAKSIKVGLASSPLGYAFPALERGSVLAKKEMCHEEEEYVLGIPVNMPISASSGLFAVLTAWTTVAAKALCNFDGQTLQNIASIPMKVSSFAPFTSFAQTDSELALLENGLQTHVGLLSLTSAVMFIGSIRGLNSLKTAHQGNYLGMAASALGILSVMASHGFGTNHMRFLATFLLAGGVGLGIAESVQMEDMPQLVAGFHSFVGLAAVLVGFANLFAVSGGGLVGLKAFEAFLGVAIGSLTMTGSIAAAGKLHGILPGAPVIPPYRWTLNAAGIASSIAMGTLFCHPAYVGAHLQPALLALNTLVWGGLGVNMVMPVGGADMPVLVSMLNSISGLATSSAGFMLGNDLLTISGALIASSGALLSDIMCKGINRSLTNVLLGGFGTSDGTIVEEEGSKGEVKELSHDALVDKLLRAKRVVIVPGYGMAVARCQQKLHELVALLTKRGVTVHFAIHPVAGRLPGHMNVLLAEAKVPYELVKEMEDVNDDIRANRYDIAVIVGANDIVNPDTAANQRSPIYGMPAVEVWSCNLCVVLKRSMATGYSGVNNPLFVLENSRMLFGDAKDSLEKLHTLALERAETLGPVAETEHENTVEAREMELVYPDPVKTLGVLKETEDKRVAITPGVVSKLRMLGYRVIVETGAGDNAGYFDSDYEARGALAVSKEELFMQAEVVVKVNEPELSDAESLRSDAWFVGSWSMMESEETSASLLKNRCTAFNMELVPRISRAQKLDTITSMANIAGYRAVLDAFNRCPRFSRTGVTACGNIPPAKVFIIGAGVAGLSAIATAQGLGATVYASDVRTAAKDQVESLGATFIEVPTPIAGEGQGGYAEAQAEEVLEKQRLLYLRMCADADVVITTAMIPHRPSPLIITEDMVDKMKSHAVVIDLAAKRGGNCGLTKADEVVVHENGVTIVGETNYPSTMAQTASDLLARNYLSMLEVLGLDELDMQDTIVRNTCVTQSGDMMYPPPKPAPVAPIVEVETPVSRRTEEPAPESVLFVIHWLEEHKEELAMGLGLGVITALGLSVDIPAKEVTHLGYFALSLLIGHFTVAAVTPSLHTPLISVTNAISGIIVVGGMLQLSGPLLSAKVVSALLAVFFSSVNIVGGFAVTKRMLDMFNVEQNE